MSKNYSYILITLLRKRRVNLKRFEYYHTYDPITRLAIEGLVTIYPSTNGGYRVTWLGPTLPDERWRV